MVVITAPLIAKFSRGAGHLHVSRSEEKVHAVRIGAELRKMGCDQVFSCHLIEYSSIGIPVPYLAAEGHIIRDGAKSVLCGSNEDLACIYEVSTFRYNEPFIPLISKSVLFNKASAILGSNYHSSPLQYIRVTIY